MEYKLKPDHKGTYELWAKNRLVTFDALTGESTYGWDFIDGFLTKEQCREAINNMGRDEILIITSDTP